LLGAVLNAGLRLIRRPPLPQPLRRKGIAKVVGFAAIGWVGYGLQTWVLALDLGAAPARALPVAIGAYAVALVLGVVVVLAPAGVGVREFMLIVGLASVLPASAATALAVVSRALVTVADVGAAAVGLLLRRWAPGVPASATPMAEADADRPH
ncbi:MAG: flippase-like domain-containing protein, partial [Streptosporangiales bacterium]|nr:flippase-like domain-containing protein [Streptosporangiales bacterium]